MQVTDSPFHLPPFHLPPFTVPRSTFHLPPSTFHLPRSPYNMAQAQAHSTRATKFLKDLGIYAIGNLGSKVITFAMVAVYTHYVSKGEMGYYDLCLAAIMLLLPFVTMQLRDGAFRFLLDTHDPEQHSSIISFIYRALLSSTVVALLLCVALAMFTSIDYLWYTFWLLIVMSIFEVITQVARGLGHNVEFVITGIISSLGIAVFSIVFVIVLPWGITGIFLANILARLFALAYLEMRMKLLTTYFRLHINVRKIGSDILKFSLPLLPSSLCWWLAASSDRWFINHYVGLETNGVYAIAARYNSIIFVLATIFYQAWQETAILQYHSPDRDKFFSRIFNTYIVVLTILLTGLSFTLKAIYPVIVDAQYQESVNYLYLMGVSSVLFSLALFFDMGYQCAKDTSRTLPAIIVAALVNVVLNFLLVKHFGVYGAIATSIITYLVLLVWRLLDMRRYLRLTFYPSTSIAVIIVLAGAIPFHLCHAWWQLLLYMAAACALALLSIPKDARNDMKLKLFQKIGIKQ